MLTETGVHMALTAIKNNAYEKSLNYCVNYAIAGLNMTGNELRVQCLYVLNNMTHWRGDTAKEVRKTLKEFTK